MALARAEIDLIQVSAIATSHKFPPLTGGEGNLIDPGPASDNQLGNVFSLVECEGVHTHPRCLVVIPDDHIWLTLRRVDQLLSLDIVVICGHTYFLKVRSVFESFQLTHVAWILCKIGASLSICCRL